MPYTVRMQIEAIPVHNDAEWLKLCKEKGTQYRGGAHSKMIEYARMRVPHPTTPKGYWEYPTGKEKKREAFIEATGWLAKQPEMMKYNYSVFDLGTSDEVWVSYPDRHLIIWSLKDKSDNVAVIDVDYTVATTLYRMKGELVLRATFFGP